MCTYIQCSIYMELVCQVGQGAVDSDYLVEIILPPHNCGVEWENHSASLL